MKHIGDFYQSEGAAKQSHAPVIHAPKTVKKGDSIEVKIVVGEEKSHPNTFDHHFPWIKLYYIPEDSDFPIEIGTYNFSAHGSQDLYTEPFVVTRFKAEKPGTLIATAYTIKHGLWECSKELKIED